MQICTLRPSTEHRHQADRSASIDHVDDMSSKGARQRRAGIDPCSLRPGDSCILRASISMVEAVARGSSSIMLAQVSAFRAVQEVSLDETREMAAAAQMVCRLHGSTVLFLRMELPPDVLGALADMV
jgi:hypothetical protein